MTLFMNTHIHALLYPEPDLLLVLLARVHVVFNGVVYHLLCDFCSLDQERVNAIDDLELVLHIMIAPAFRHPVACLFHHGSDYVVFRCRQLVIQQLPRLLDTCVTFNNSVIERMRDSVPS